MRRYAIAACLLFAVPASAQNSTLHQILSGKDVPLTMKLKELTSEWRRVSLTGPVSAKNPMSDIMNTMMQAGAAGKGGGDKMGEMLGMSMLSGMFGGGNGGGEEARYYTQGNTVTVSGETFLVAYKLDKPQTSFMQLVMDSQKNGGKEPDFAKLSEQNKVSGDTTVSLSLTSMKAITGISNIRPFDLAAEIADSGKTGGGLMDLLALAGQRTELKPVEQPHAETSVAAAPEVSPTGAVLDELAKTGHNKYVKGLQVTSEGSSLILRGTAKSPALRDLVISTAKSALKHAGSNLSVRSQLVVERK
jgi:hypothetical protein